MSDTKKLRKVVIRNTKSKLQAYLPVFEALLGGKNGQGATAYFTPTNVISDKQIVVFAVARGEDMTAVLSAEQRLAIFKKYLPENKKNADKITYPPQWAQSGSNIFHIALPLDSSGQKALVKLTYNAIIEQGAICEAMYFLNDFARINDKAVSKETMQALYEQVSKKIGYPLPVTHFAHHEQIRERTDSLLSMLTNEKDRTKAARMIDVNLALAVKEVTAQFENSGLKIPEPKFKVLGGNKVSPV